METIFIDYSPFTQDSIVYIDRDGVREKMSIKSDVNAVAQELLALAYKYNIYSVKIAGPFAMTSEFSKQIAELEQQIYSVNKINVEGI